MAKFTKYLTSWLIYSIIVFFIGWLLDLIIINTTFMMIIDLVISIGIIYVIATYRELNFWKLLVLIFAINIILTIIMIILTLVWGVLL